MVRIEDVIRYNINRCSHEIHVIKSSTLQTEKVKKVVFDNEATPPQSRTVEYEKVIAHINPKHPSWARYRGLKMECSHWLTLWKYHKVMIVKTPVTNYLSKEVWDHQARKCDLTKVADAYFKLKTKITKGTVKIETHYTATGLERKEVWTRKDYSGVEQWLKDRENDRLAKDFEREVKNA